MRYSRNKLYSILLVVVAIGFFFSIKLSGVLISILTLFWIFSGEVKNINSLKENPLAILMIGIYLIYIFGMLFTENEEEGLFQLEKAVPIILFPLILGSTSIKIPFKKRILLFFFALTSFIVSFILLTWATIRYQQTLNSDVFFFYEFCSLINFNPIYFAAYILFSLTIIIGFLKEKIHTILLLLLILYGLFILVLLGSKIILFLAIPLIGITYRPGFKHLLIIVAFFVVSIFSIDYTFNRIKDIFTNSLEVVEKDQFPYNQKFSGLTLRLVQWKLILSHFIKDDLILTGVGTGDAGDYYNKVYSLHGLDHAGYLDYNIHNQYLEILIRFGLFGFLYYLYFLFNAFKVAFIKKDILFISFLLIFCTISLTESFLGVNKGIVLFAFFLSYFLFVESEKRETISN